MITFEMFGCEWWAWHALNERETRRVLRLATRSRPSKAQYREAMAHARLLLAGHGEAAEVNADAA